ncbi:hypothetical protein M413DRAFT_442420 [Hebeloma cylindrosporum]|uniref:Uncharacterized protein n=1 Tax=Hebeloma cylindrosporum TaxID=76867 RepID=A0A0C3CK09_HEBCY|nr:hypothetical protein M413DRAFT_442420 [Hebeloma cylindrosporum h7]
MHHMYTFHQSMSYVSARHSHRRGLLNWDARLDEHLGSQATSKQYLRLGCAAVGLWNRNRISQHEDSAPWDPN